MVRPRAVESNDDQLDSSYIFQPEVHIEEKHNLVWRFPLAISQSSLGGRTHLSNACTLIALKIAELIHIHDIDMPNFYAKKSQKDRALGGAEMIFTTRRGEGVAAIQKESIIKKECPSNIISCLVNGIIDGNEAYIQDAGEESTRNYNLPDAINACESNFSEVDFKLTNGSIKDSLPKLIKSAVQHSAFQTQRRLVFILISCVRTVLIIFDRNFDSLTLFDAHHHFKGTKPQKHGALIGTCRFGFLNSFSNWIRNFVFPDLKNDNEIFEISLVQLSERGTRKIENRCDYIEKSFYSSKKTRVFEVEKVENADEEEKENWKPFDYPVLRSILSKRPLGIGSKRRIDSINGEINYCAGGKREKSS